MFEEYLKAVSAGLGYFGTWLPNVPIALGAVGVIDSGGRFRHATSLETLLGRQPESRGRARANIKYQSAGGVGITFKAAGQAPIPNCPIAQADAGVAVEFSRENSIVLEATGCTIEAFTDTESIGVEILRRVDAKLWRENYIVITEVVKASGVTILMSASSSSRFDATAGAGVAFTAATSLGDAKLGLNVQQRRALGIEIVAEPNLTPLFSAWRVKKGWFNNGRWEPAKSIQGPIEKLGAADLLELTKTPEAHAPGRP